MSGVAGRFVRQHYHRNVADIGRNFSAGTSGVVGATCGGRTTWLSQTYGGAGEQR
jgi:hypothetical protein